MKLYHVVHTLIPKTSLNRRVAKAPRRTVLLRVVFDDGQEGFANLHVNPERVGVGPPSLQTSLALRMARLDAKSRTAKKSLWEGVSIPACHYLFTEIDSHSLEEFRSARKRGFEKFKIKTGRDLEKELDFLNAVAEEASKKSLRPDFNQALDPKQLARFVRQASPLLIDAIDFVEDPTTDRPEIWSQASDKIRWGWDQHSEQFAPWDKGFAALILKPAIQDILALTPTLKKFPGAVVFTSYMDHPVGQLGAAWMAAQFYAACPEKRNECGLMSHGIFEPTPYSECLRTDGPRLLPPEGIGIGFGDLLEKEPWKKLEL